MNNILEDIKTIAEAVSNDKVVLASGFVATRDEVEWAKEEIADSPDGMYASIEEAISVKRSFDEVENGEYELSSQY